jgi:hypothetical protein
MSERGAQLHATAEAQIDGLIELFSTHDDATLRLACPDRQKLGDGSVAASAQHTADNYHRIADWLPDGGRLTGMHRRPGKSGHRIPGFARERHTRRGHPERDGYSADIIDRQQLLTRLTTARSALGVLAELTDEQLTAVPPASDMKFCDGQRTLEQVIANLLNHQGHQIDAITSAVA